MKVSEQYRVMCIIYLLHEGYYSVYVTPFRVKDYYRRYWDHNSVLKRYTLNYLKAYFKVTRPYHSRLQVGFTLISCCLLYETPNYLEK